MNVRWWRLAIVYEESGEPWTWTFHVRAFTEKRARALVGESVGRAEFAVYVCHPSDPLPTALQQEAVVADYGPYRRSWDDVALRPLRARLHPDA